MIHNVQIKVCTAHFLHRISTSCASLSYEYTVTNLGIETWMIGQELSVVQIFIAYWTCKLSTCISCQGHRLCYGYKPFNFIVYSIAIIGNAS